MSELRKSINSFLEGLVHNRFSKEELETKLSEYFKFPVTVDDTSKYYDELADFNLLFGMDFKYPTEHIYGYVDLYYLKTREEDKPMYITEVAVEFE